MPFVNNPWCGVKSAVERGEILRERYEAYRTLLAEVGDKS